MGNNKPIAIIRVVTGLGDMIMARPAIIASIKARPKTDHVLYCMSHTAPIVEDIEGLRTIIVPGEHVSSRMVNVEKILDPKDYLSVYNLNQCCLHYEVSRQPKVDRGRAELFCDELCVRFDINNYNVKFTDKEMDFAHTFMKKYWYYPYHVVGIHIRPSMIWREYPYMDWLIEHVAKRLDGYVVTIDDKYQYNGRYKNIISLVHDNIREVWACMSMMDAGIGVDSFGCHAWASTGVSTYGIFGPTDPKQFLKYPAKVGWHSLTKLCPLGQRCWYKPCSIKEGKEPERPPRCLSCIWPPSIWRDAVQKLDLQYMVKHKYTLKKPTEAVQSSLAEFIDLSAVTNIQKVNNDDVALLILEGLGGTMSAADHAAKIYKSSGKNTHLFIRKNPELFRDNPYISGVECVGAGEHGDYLDYILKSFDAVAVIKTGLGRWYHENGVIFEQDYERWKDLYERLPLGTNALEKYKLNFIQTTNYSLGLRFGNIESFAFAKEKYEGLTQRYIVISNGVDTDHKGATQTKSWPGEYWQELISYLDIAVVQVGTTYDKKIKGAIDLRGQTSIPQLLGVLGDATAVVCQEGGLMHLSYAVGQRNVFVLRGPTQGYFFRYPGHHCIDSVNCGGCYWQTMLWWRDCPRNIDAECMKSIHPDYVAAIVKSEMLRTGAY